MKGNSFILMTLSRNGYQHNRLIDGCLEKTLEIDVSNYLPNKQKRLTFKQRKFFYSDEAMK